MRALEWQKKLLKVENIHLIFVLSSKWIFVKAEEFELVFEFRYLWIRIS